MKRAILILLFPVLAYAQDLEFELQPDAFPVEINNWQLFQPWTGGETEVDADFCDIDADGDFDLFVGNYSGKLTYYDNRGTSTSPDFAFVTRDYAGISLGYPAPYAGRTSPEFCDIDADGDLDLFSGDFRGLLHYWENVGTPQNAIFQLVSDTLQGIDVTGYSKMSFKDLDADGDLDLLIGTYQGDIWFYQNTGSATAFDFVLQTTQFNGIDVGMNASPCLVDVDGDDDLDLFVGERYGKLWYYRNDGDSVFTYVTDFYDSIDVGDYASPEFADIDGDGDYDLFVGREPAAGSLMGDVFFYENIGTPIIPQFRLITKTYLTLDLGPYVTNPQLVDLNGDNAPDLVAGVTSVLDYFVNTGIPGDPGFAFEEEGFQGISRIVIKPCFGDLDGDGDYDMLAGEGVIPGPPTVALYLNQGTPQNPQLVLYDPNFVTNLNFFVNTNPGLADIDADGDYDLFISDDDGHFYYYQNDGTPLWPSYTLTAAQWQGIQFYYPECGWRGFCFADLDDDGDLDLLMENVVTSVSEFNLRYYRNDGTPQLPNMVLETNFFLPQYWIYRPCPYLVDIDLDGDLDLFCSDESGGIQFFRNVTGEPPAVPPLVKHPQAGFHLSIGPNPANPVTFITFSLPYPQEATLAVYNLLGARVTTLTSGLQPPGEQSFLWDASRKASGVYVVRLEGVGEVRAGKILVVK